MEEIKIWAIDGSGAVADLEPAGQTETENLLEDALVNRPDLLFENLTLVGRQTYNEGGWLDLLGVDGNGRLVVFELKRGTVRRDAVAQVIDYASSLDRMDLVALANYISEKSSQHDDIDTIEDFEDWYSRYSEDLESLKPLRMVLVGLGVDPDAERMVKFLAESVGMDISLLTFHGFNYDGKTILAKQVEVQGTESPPRGGSSNRSRQEIRNELNDLVDRLGIRGLFDSVRAVFRENWSKSDEKHNVKSIGVSLPSSAPLGKSSYVRIDAKDLGEVRIAFYPRAVKLSKDAFRQAIGTIPYETYPPNPDPLGTGINFLIDSDKWETYEEEFTQLLQAIYQAWQGESSGE